MCAAVHVRTGDIIFVESTELRSFRQEVAEEAVVLALEEARRQDDSRGVLQAGAYLRDVYARDGAL